MAIRLYTVPVSNYGAKVEIALRLKGIAYEALPPPGGYGSPTYKALVPQGTVPAIVDGDLVLAESETINEYLNEAWPEPPLLPTEPKARARVRQLARFHDSRLEPPLRALFPQMAPEAREPVMVARELCLFLARLADLASMVEPAPWLGGAEITLADLPYAPTLLMARLMLLALGEPVELPEALARWQNRASIHPAFAPVLAMQEEAMRDWLASKGVAG